MDERPVDPDLERRLRNLEAVAHHQARGGIAADQARVQNRSRWKRWITSLGPLGIALMFILGKLKFLVPLLKVAQFGTLLSMFFMIWVYAQMWGWAFALGFVLLIFVHELGHALVMQQQGIPAGAPVFIPFVGAVIAMRGQPRDAWVEALVGIGGPVLGSVGALACLIVAWVSGAPFWYALASTGFLLNLFNLLPISPLDGGRIVGVISRWLWVAGYALGIGALLVTRSPMLFLILLIGLFGIRRTVRGPHAGYFDAAPGRRIAMGVAYFGLIILLALGMWIAREPLDALQESLQQRADQVATLR
jgi:Zn-dependent protease